MRTKEQAPARRRLEGVESTLTPPQAKALYAHPAFKRLALGAWPAARIEDSPRERALLQRIFAERRGQFSHELEREDVWGNFVVRVRRTILGRYVRLFFGDCDDFAVLMIYALTTAGVPRGALRLAICEIKGYGGHAVLLVDTADVTYVVDVRQRAVLPADAPAFAAYDWRAAESHPHAPGGAGRWVSLRRRTLADVWSEAAGGEGNG